MKKIIIIFILIIGLTVFIKDEQKEYNKSNVIASGIIIKKFISVGHSSTHYFFVNWNKFPNQSV
jgi:hypothetical protein